MITQIALQPKILKEIHLPVQSGSNRILKLMNRKYTREHYLSVVNKIKTLIPNARITTDFIVGFPSETEQDFEQTMSLLQQVEFDMVFAFMYSKRPHTPAEKMPDQVDEQTKHRRVNQLLALAKQIQNKKQSQKAE